MSPTKHRSATSSPPWAILPFAALLLAAALFLSGCNTAEGFGDDLEEAGEEVGDAVD
jgi:predicted small secreted protein